MFTKTSFNNFLSFQTSRQRCFASREPTDVLLWITGTEDGTFWRMFRCKVMFLRTTFYLKNLNFWIFFRITSNMLNRVFNVVIYMIYNFVTFHWIGSKNPPSRGSMPTDVSISSTKFLRFKVQRSKPSYYCTPELFEYITFY